MNTTPTSTSNEAIKHRTSLLQSNHFSTLLGVICSIQLLFTSIFIGRSDDVSQTPELLRSG
jgi:hypothetical protein